MSWVPDWVLTLVCDAEFNAGFDSGQINDRRAIVHELDFKARGNDERGLPGKAGDKVGWSGRQAEGGRIRCRRAVDKCNSPLEGSWLCRTVGMRSLLGGGVGGRGDVMRITREFAKTDVLR